MRPLVTTMRNPSQLAALEAELSLVAQIAQCFEHVAERDRRATILVKGWGRNQEDAVADRDTRGAGQSPWSGPCNGGGIRAFDQPHQISSELRDATSAVAGIPRVIDLRTLDQGWQAGRGWGDVREFVSGAEGLRADG
jgi:hypothetical protein